MELTNLSGEALRLIDAMVQAATPYLATSDDLRPEILSQSSHSIVLRLGSLVAKAHAKDTNREVLAARCEILSLLEPEEIFMPRHRATPILSTCGHPLTLWDAGEPLRVPASHQIPWESCAQLLANPTGFP